MNYNRISELYSLLDVESKKTPIDSQRIAEINHYLSLEMGTPVGPPKSWLDWFQSVIPSNWRVYVTGLIGAFVAFNAQTHVVTQSVQDTFLAVAVALGLWAVHTQTSNFDKLKVQAHAQIEKLKFQVHAQNFNFEKLKLQVSKKGNNENA